MERITIQNAEKIKNILLNNYLDNKSISLEYKNIKTIINIDGITESKKSELFDDRDMQMFSFLHGEQEGNLLCMEVNNKKHQLYMNIGEWGVSGRYKYDIHDMHIVLGTTSSKFGAKELFSQIEISQALEYKYYVYLVKNISDLAGKGAIARLNSGLKDKKLKYERRNILINRLNTTTKPYEGKEWMIVSKISKEDLDSEQKHNDIFYTMIKDILNYSFTVEDIIAEDKILNTVN
ncbi:hypothetical protein KWV42_10460 [Clostridioides difficile]|uniref:hypothetical protein n=1 Tax=Clostridioides difficile TaxID=1496 RepID=UPI0010BAA45E|nr:hypothetical protein [Clostridioides difficile]MBY1883508.1 hypothetical protein [Clostridioides difficile]MBZ0781373.1 hypothetical protein [Clostridioides difficile]MBZ0855017.1 hypothetical protein [Clostridioides difficile]MCG7701633.1 hypothetical protein [Clostridioides difficile]